MGLKPDHIESQKRAAERRLAARTAQLEARGCDERALRRDPLIRKARADIRQATRRQERVAELETQSAALARAKAGGAPEEKAPKKQDGKKAKAEKGA